VRDLGPEVVVKFVATRAGSAACAALAARNVPTLLTAVYDPGQAIVAAAAGATYIAPYLGRLNDAGRQGITEVVAMHEVLSATHSTTKVLVASIRTVPDMVALASEGVDCFTMAPAVVLRLRSHCGSSRLATWTGRGGRGAKACAAMPRSIRCS
jgi:transaldolase